MYHGISLKGKHKPEYSWYRLVCKGSQYLLQNMRKFLDAIRNWHPILYDLCIRDHLNYYKCDHLLIFLCVEIDWDRNLILLNATYINCIAVYKMIAEMYWIIARNRLSNKAECTANFYKYYCHSQICIDKRHRSKFWSDLVQESLIWPKEILLPYQ